ncbi:MAG: hypothetical protein M1828_006563 [Chrysothrix sp. TS-e1954]|nr:MAG: hypothetical protein M1828_006563 [Chrysothrix sp. TS-e1954]
MAREAAPPRAEARRGAAMSPQKGSLKGSIRVPLNDDRQEKAQRQQSRHALHEIQMNSIRAAASPAKRRSLGPITNGSPRTPDSHEKENDGLGVVGGNAVTPLKRVPILANFEEWMKMATDNKINATNSWNFALIDYFHDMSLLREGSSVNFQKASCTLDGCVKIYTSRVDSVATETGKLLSGLADSGNKKRKADDEDRDGEEEDEDEEGEEGVKKRAKKRVQRTSEATLASSFAQLQLKKMDLEFSVDPLFKKASADFDEGGAKGLLLNHLTIDSDGRIVFDSSDDTNDTEQTAADQATEDEDHRNVTQSEKEADDERVHSSDDSINIDALAQRFFPDLSILDEQDICPSLKTYELGGASDALDIPFLRSSDDWKKDASPSKDQSSSSNLIDDAAGFGTGDDDDNDDVGLVGFGVEGEVGFGEGGEAWAKDAAVNTQMRPYDASRGDEVMATEDGGAGDVGGYEADSAGYGITLRQDNQSDRDHILSYFDQALQKNWAGPEHWRIRKMKDNNRPAPPRQRKEKEPFEIDFTAPLSKAVSDAIYTTAASNSAICLPKSQWKSKTRNLLPDDKHFNSSSLLRLFLKPKARIGARSSGISRQTNDALQGPMDEAFWARQQAEMLNAPSTAADGGAQASYDANFFQDDGLEVPGGGLPDDDDEEFADARETFSPGRLGNSLGPAADSIDGVLASGGQDNGFGAQLVTQSRRIRPEYVQYARVAKKVDVRRLKEEMWRGLGLEESKQVEPEAPPTPSNPPNSPPATEDDGSLKFTSVMNSLQSVYPKQAMEDISTSYCFICLLHLANEKGLVLGHDDNFEEIRIRRDLTAEVVEGD